MLDVACQDVVAFVSILFPARLLNICYLHASQDLNLGVAEKKIAD